MAHRHDYAQDGVPMDKISERSYLFSVLYFLLGSETSMSPSFSRSVHHARLVSQIQIILGCTIMQLLINLLPLASAINLCARGRLINLRIRLAFSGLGFWWV